MVSARSNLVQIDFVSPEGRKERLWAEATGENEASILSVPVWIYGVSVGSVVRTGGERPRLLRASPGGTLRFLATQGASGKHLYLTRVIPDLRAVGLGIGPATFFGPRLVAMHVHERKSWWPEIGSYLDALVTEGAIEQWEAGDPDQGGVGDEAANETVTGSVLVHPLPVDPGADAELS